MNATNGGRMKLLLASALGLLMGLGAYALVQATLKERDADRQYAAHLLHCQEVTALIIEEFDALLARGAVPTQDQQDRWRHVSVGCE